jgi:signal transduction histidine kinase
MNHPHSLLPAITHELKTPLNAIIGFADLLREEIAGEIFGEGGKSPGTQSSGEKEIIFSYLAEIIQAASEMNELVHDLLDVSAVASGKFSLDLSKKIDVKNSVIRAMKLNQGYAMRRGIKLSFEAASDLPLIHLDCKRMRQILTNLISNAVKYSPSQTEVKVVARLISGHLEITIADQGFGMSEEQISQAFEKYQTIDNPNSGKVDSFGLGLPIVKELVESQGGSIVLESRIGEGTKIKLRFATDALMMRRP